jgi:hypothetical protein
MTKAKSWESKLLDEPRLGFVEEHGSRSWATKRARRLPESTQKLPRAEAPLHDPLSKILNEPRIGFDAMHRTSGERLR